MIDFEIQLIDLDTGKVNRLTHWRGYSVGCSIFNPASTFSAEIAAIKKQRDFTAHGGQKAQVFSYGALQSTAITDERSEDTSTSASDLHIAGRGVGGLLVDSAVGLKDLSLANLTLSQWADRVTAPWQPDFITTVSTSNSANRYVMSGGASYYSTKGKMVVKPFRDKQGNIIKDTDGSPLKGSFYEQGKTGKNAHKKFGKASPYYRGNDEKLRQTRVQPGTKIWDQLKTLAAQIGCMVFVGCDGTLIIDRPNYAMSPDVYGEGIVLTWDQSEQRATGGNISGVRFETSIADRHSETIALGTGKSKKTTAGKKLLKNTWTVKDPSPAFWKRQSTPPYLTTNKLYKPNILSVGKNLSDKKMLRRMVRGELEQQLIQSFSLEYQMPGHFINGVLPVPDSMINVRDERNGITDAMYITEVQRKFDISSGKTQVIKLIPAKIWMHFDHDTTSDDEYLEHLVQRVYW